MVPPAAERAMVYLRVRCRRRTVSAAQLTSRLVRYDLLLKQVKGTKGPIDCKELR